MPKGVKNHCGKTLHIPDRQARNRACLRSLRSCSERQGHRPYEWTARRPGLSLFGRPFDKLAKRLHYPPCTTVPPYSAVPGTTDLRRSFPGRARQASELSGKKIDLSVRARGAIRGPALFSWRLEGMSPRRAKPALPNTRSSPLDGGLPQGRRLFLWLRERALEKARRRVGLPDAGTVSAMDASLPRVGRLAVSEQLYRRLALASAVMLIVIVASGTTVRLTGSGLGCLHWPGCQAGDPFPKTGYHSLHRVLEPGRRRDHDLRDPRRLHRLAPGAVGADLGALGGRARVRRARSLRRRSG